MMKKRSRRLSIFQKKNRRGQSPTIFQKKNRKGWLKIVEAFVAILLVATVALIVISRNAGSRDISGRVYEAEISILREIQLNNTMRTLVLGVQILSSGIGVESDNANFPSMVKNKINERTPSYLACKGKICTPEDSCFLADTSGIEKEIYAQSVIITVASGSTTYVPKQLKLFCWQK